MVPGKIDPIFLVDSKGFFFIWVVLGIAGDVEKVEEMRRNNVNVWPVVGKLSDVESLQAAMAGCRGVFHTSGFVDPTGLTGYSVSSLSLDPIQFYFFIFLFF